MHPDIEHKRYVMVLRDGEWQKDGLENIKRGDVYKMFEIDGTSAIAFEGCPAGIELIALEDAYEIQEGPDKGFNVADSGSVMEGYTKEQMFNFYSK
jgi:hypothetical protein